MNKERVFFLSAKEAKLVTYSDKQADGGVEWWLRSPIANGTAAGIVDGDRNVISKAVSETIYARPACNLDAKRILFTQSAIDFTGNATMQKINSISNTANVWKLTLLDSSRDGFRAYLTASNVNINGGTLTIAYSGAETGSNEHVSVLLCDADGRAAVCYGVSAPLTNAGQSGGTVTFTLPKLPGLGGRHTLYVFNEQRNSAKFSNYASAFQKTTLSVLGFGSGESYIENNTINYWVDGAPRNALLIAARYDGGKMTDVQTLDLADAEEKADDLTMRGSGTDFTLFLVDKTTFAPLCPAVVRKKSP